MGKRFEGVLHNSTLRATLLGLGFVGTVGGGAIYNSAHIEKDPIRVPARSSSVLDPASDTLTVTMPEGLADTFDCGSEVGPVSFLDVHNPEKVVAQRAGRVAVECDLMADVPIIGANGQPIG